MGGRPESEGNLLLPTAGQVPQVVISLDDDDDDDDGGGADDDDGDDLTVGDRDIFFAEMLTRVVGMPARDRLVRMLRHGLTGVKDACVGQQASSTTAGGDRWSARSCVWVRHNVPMGTQAYARPWLG